jgi:hypothetical protein
MGSASGDLPVPAIGQIIALSRFSPEEKLIRGFIPIAH